MNDIGLAAPPIDNPVTQALVEALAEARAGKIHGIVIVKAYGPEAWNTSVHGRFLYELNLGCDVSKDIIKQNALKPASPIIRAVGEVPRNN